MSTDPHRKFEDLVTAHRNKDKKEYRYQHKEWIGTPCRASPTFHPFSRARCLGLSSLCPHSDASATQPTSRQCITDLTGSSTPSESWTWMQWCLNSFLQPFFFIFVRQTSLLSPGICPSNRRGSHTGVCLKQQQTKTSRQLSFPLPRKTHTCFLGEALGNVTDCRVQYWMGTQKVTDTIGPASPGMAIST